MNIKPHTCCRVLFSRYKYLFWSFLYIGSISFGGYMALIAMVRERLVQRDRLLDEETMTEAIALASLLPGPIAVNVVAYAGYVFAGVAGAVVSIVAVLLPSYLLVLLLSALYIEYKSVFDFSAILMGITPVIIGIIFSVCLNMWIRNCNKISDSVIAIVSVSVLLFFPGYWSTLLVLLAAGLFGLIIYKEKSGKEKLNWNFKGLKYARGPAVLITLYLIISYGISENISLKLFAEFSSVSLTLFGGGYVMVPVLKSLLVDQLQWFTNQEFIFGISLGQITPGPILISAVYFGYKMNGIIGSVAATLGIFIPSSLVMIIASRFYIQLRENRRVKAIFAGIKPAVTGLIFYSGISLFFNHVEANNLWFSLTLTFIAFLSLLRFNINPAIVVFFGGLLGYLTKLFL